MLLYIKKVALDLMELDVQMNHTKTLKHYRSFTCIKKELVDIIDGFQENDNSL